MFKPQSVLKHQLVFRTTLIITYGLGETKTLNNKIYNNKTYCIDYNSDSWTFHGWAAIKLKRELRSIE